MRVSDWQPGTLLDGLEILTCSACLCSRMLYAMGKCLSSLVKESVMKPKSRLNCLQFLAFRVISLGSRLTKVEFWMASAFFSSFGSPANSFLQSTSFTFIAFHGNLVGVSEAWSRVWTTKLVNAGEAYSNFPRRAWQN